jgi:hypothetical protein
MWTPVVVPSSAGTSHHAPWPEDALTGSVLRPRTFFLPAYDLDIAPPTHYDVLGIPPDADQAHIRVAYVARARELHPDSVAASPGATGSPGSPGDHSMAELNRSYEVLRSPASRLAYDRALRSGGAVDADPTGADSDDWAPEFEESGPQSPGARLAGRVLTPTGPARMPWKLMAVAALIGSVVVLVGAALAEPSAVETPDGILQVGSCVTIEANGDAREIACSEAPDRVVRRLLPTGSTCPPAYGTHRDRLGLGTVCVETT